MSETKPLLDFKEIPIKMNKKVYEEHILEKTVRVLQLKSNYFSAGVSTSPQDEKQGVSKCFPRCKIIYEITRIILQNIY